MFKRVILLPCIILHLLSCSEETDTTASTTWKVDDSERVFAVESLLLTKGNLYPKVKASGLISGIREAYIISETKGIIKSVNFEIGDFIDRDTTLLEVDSSIAQLSLNQAKEQYDSAKLDLISTEKFYKKGTASLSDLTRARSSANGAQVIYETALKAVKDSSIKPPIAGDVAWKESGITQGNYINPGQKVAKVVDLSSIRVEISLGERQIGLIKEGSPVEITVKSIKGDNRLYGEVIAIAAGSDQSTGSFKVVVLAENTIKEDLKAGLSCSVEIDTAVSTLEYMVPTSSIVERSNKTYIFIERNGIAEPIEVLIREVAGNNTTIDIDIEDNSQVIISGLSSIKPGVKVKTTNIGKTGEWL